MLPYVIERIGENRIVFASDYPHWDALFPTECYLVFGPETRGLPESLLREHAETCLGIPMQGTRSLNLATSVGIVLYEAMRQHR